MEIPFNRLHFFGEEQQYISDVMSSGEVAGNGAYTHKCHQFFKNHFQVKHCLLTNSCTAALEMAAILLNIQPGDEVILPAYGYVSTANSFALRGAKLVFVDAMEDSPNLNVDLLTDLITDKTKAIVVMHYGGIAVDMDYVMTLAESRGIYVIEDAAHGIDAYFKDRPLGTIGHLGTISFHSTKNITSGHGGLLLVNDSQFVERANVIWQKGTDKTKFDLGHQKYYQWIDIGSSFFPSELTAAYLFGQLLYLKNVTQKRRELWEYYYSSLATLTEVDLPKIPEFAQHNGHIFFLKFKDKYSRNRINKHLQENNITTYSHYLDLTQSPFLAEENSTLFMASDWENTLLRLPMFYNLSFEEVDYIVRVINTM